MLRIFPVLGLQTPQAPGLSQPRLPSGKPTKPACHLFGVDRWFWGTAQGKKEHNGQRTEEIPSSHKMATENP